MTRKNDDPQQEHLPVTFQDKILGTFTFDQEVNWYQAKVIWNGESVRLTLSVETESDLEKTLQVAHALWKDQAIWCRRITEYAVCQLLPLKNESWLDDEELELDDEEFDDEEMELDDEELKIDADEFKARMELESINLHSDGSFEFWHDDGDLFWGHSILISGSLQDGPTGADIPG